MISTVNTQKPTGSTAIQCDPGTPISGRTSDTGTYQILKVNPDGSLPFGGAIETQVPTTSTPLATTIPVPGLKASGICCIYDLITPTQPILDGIYKVNPMIVLEANPTGAFNCALVKVGSTIDAYINTRVLGVDGFTPTINDFLTGFAIWWHALPIQTMGGGNEGFAQLNAQDKTVRLEAGNYRIFFWIETAITTISPTAFVSFSEFTKIG